MTGDGRAAVGGDPLWLTPGLEAELEWLAGEAPPHVRRTSLQSELMSLPSPVFQSAHAVFGLSSFSRDAAKDEVFIQAVKQV